MTLSKEKLVKTQLHALFFWYGIQGLPFETIDRSIMQIDRLEALSVIDFSIASLPGQLFIKVPK